jgi:hypothetical protein
MPEQVSKLYHKHAVPVLVVLIAILSIGFGYSLGVREGLSSLVALGEQQAAERKSTRAHYAHQIGELRKELKDSRIETKEALGLARGDK